MDGLIVLGVLAVIWVLVGPIVALANAVGAKRNVRLLLQRIEMLEARVAGGISPPATADQPDAAAEAVPAPEAASARERPSFAEAFGPSAQPPAESPTPAAPEMVLSASAPETFPPEPPAAPTPPKESLESKIGARWTVLVGGLALALGAVFLVRYSIEAGLLGPGARITAGFLLSAILFAAGEYMRRHDSARALLAFAGAHNFAGADVPAILTGAAGIALFATIYAAYALYGFVGPAAAFVLLTAAGLLTLFLSVIHGPSLAALGALGSYVAPLLVSSAEPAPFPIVFHTLAVTAAVLGMARIRMWKWLAIGGLIGSLGWGFLLGQIEAATVTQAELLLIGGLMAIYIGALLIGMHPTGLRDRSPDLIALVALAGVSALSLSYVNGDPLYPPLVSAILLCGILGAVASRWTPVAAAALIAGVLAAATVMLLAGPEAVGLDTMRIGAFAWTILGDQDLGRFALRSAAVALVVGIGCFLSADRAAAAAPLTAGMFAASGALAPLAILVVVYLRHVPFETRPAIGIAALIMAAIYAAMTEKLIARRPHDDMAPAPALYAAGAVLALSFAASVGLATRFIPISLSLGAAGTVWVGLYRPVRLLAWLAVGVAALAAVAVVFGPPLTMMEIGMTPILNGLILRFGLPALAILFAGETLRRRRDGIEAAILQTIGLVFAALFVAIEIRHWATGGVLSSDSPPGLGEQGALTLAALAFSLGLQKIAGRTKNKVYEVASLIAGILGAAAIAVAHFITANPLFTDYSVGESNVLNDLLPGYLLPALAAAWVAAAARPVRPRWYVLLVAALALLLAFAYVTLTVRHVFQGQYLGGFEMSDAENWTYSAVWLVFGILLLAAGIFLRSTMVRAASGLVIAVVIFKVFLFDMAALTGVLRAASFLGLGAVLIVIGRLYQRLLMRGRAEPEPAAPA